MNRLFLIVGRSGSGKDFFTRNYLSKFANRIVSTTTRPKREGEVEGDDYYFVNKGQFQEKLSAGAFFNNVEYSGNCYGLTKDELLCKMQDTDAYIIIEPSAIEEFKVYGEQNNIEVRVVFIQASKALRERQLLARGENPTFIKTRMNNDESLFTFANIRYDYCFPNTGDSKGFSIGIRMLYPQFFE